VFRFILSLASIMIAVGGCHDSGDTPLLVTGIQGQVYSIATPGPTPVGWVPPPLEIISTVLVLDSSHKLLIEVLTDNKGKFSVELQPGTYYLRVKESMIPAETGPYVLSAGELLTVRAHYDSGMR
jgi:hypothetical protein